MIPGEMIPFQPGKLNWMPRCDVVRVQVANVSDRPIEVGSTFPKVNTALEFDREQARGMRHRIFKACTLEPGMNSSVSTVCCW